jgi:hypothetical protein
MNNSLSSKLLKQYFESEAELSYLNKNEAGCRQIFNIEITNKRLMKNFENFFCRSMLLEHLNLNEDMEVTESLFSSILKEFISLPKLRKYNKLVEHGSNSIHQKHNYEFLFEQQDLYDYYENQYKNISSVSINFSNPIYSQVKREDLPFSKCLQNFSEIYMMYHQYDDLPSKLKLAKFRWYCNDKEFLRKNSKDINSQPINLGNDLPLNSVFQLIANKILNFCKFSSQYLQKFKFDENMFYSSKKLSGSIFKNLDENNFRIILDQIFLNEYIKRSKSFFEAASTLNEEMENFNVLINYLYESFFPNYPCFPKFSIYRFMVTTWNSEVLAPLVEENYHSLNIISSTERLFNFYLQKQMKFEFGKECKYDTDISDLFFSNLANSSSNNYFQPTENDYLKNIDSNFNSEYNLKHIIEQTASSLLDPDCNEFSVYYINHSQMKISNIFNKLERVIMSSWRNALCSFFSNNSLSEALLGNLINFTLSDGINFFNRTKCQLLMIVQELINKKFKTSQFIDKEAYITVIENEYDHFLQLDKKIIKENLRKNIQYDIEENNESLLQYKIQPLAKIEEIFLHNTFEITSQLYEKYLVQERDLFVNQENLCEFSYTDLKCGNKINNTCSDEVMSNRSTIGSFNNCEIDIEMEN